MSLGAQDEERWLAYRANVRAEGRPARFAGFVACLIGVLLLVFARFRLGGAPWMLWTGASIVAIGWGLFIYALARRLLWIRAHPFDTTPSDPSE